MVKYQSESKQASRIASEINMQKLRIDTRLPMAYFFERSVLVFTVINSEQEGKVHLCLKLEPVPIAFGAPSGYLFRVLKPKLIEGGSSNGRVHSVKFTPQGEAVFLNVPHGKYSVSIALC